MMKKALILGGILFTLFSCGPEGQLYEVTVQADYSEMLEDFSRPYSSEFKEVLEDAKADRSAEDLVESFFKHAKKRYPDKPLRTYFRNVYGVKSGMPDQQVKQKIRERRDQLLNAFVKKLNEGSLPEGFEIDQAEKQKGGKVRISLYSSEEPKMIRNLFFSEMGLSMHEVYPSERLPHLIDKLVEKRMQKVEIEPFDSTAEYSLDDLDMDIGTETQSVWQKATIGSGGAFAFCPLQDVPELLDSLNTLHFKEAENIKFYAADEKEMRNGELPIYACNLNESGSMIVSNEFVASAEAFFNEETQSRGVSVIMTEKGREKFAQLTSENVGNMLAMVLNDEIVMSAPLVQSAITNGEVEISGNFDEEEAKNLAGLIRAPNWGLPLYIIDGPKRK